MHVVMVEVIGAEHLVVDNLCAASQNITTIQDLHRICHVAQHMQSAMCLAIAEQVLHVELECLRLAVRHVCLLVLDLAKVQI